MTRAALKIHETTAGDGSLTETFLVANEDGSLAIVSSAEGAPTRKLPYGSLEAVMKRYGAELDVREKLVEVAALTLDDGRRVRHVRHLGFYDVIARDYLVYELGDGSSPLFAMAITVAGALEHLARSRVSSVITE